MTIRSVLLNALTVIVSIVICFAALELFLLGWSFVHVAEQKSPVAAPPPTELGTDVQVPSDILEKAKSRQQVLTMPDSWKRRPAQVPGAASAEYWQDVLHVYNSEGMRWSTPYPPKRADTYRVMVVGDSLAYGTGLEIEWRFSNLLERWMGEKFNIEFINLGRPGAQSEDVRKIVSQHLPTIKPDLVLYAICLNDFLPAGKGEYVDLDAYSFPIPSAAKAFLIRHTRAAPFLSDIYDRVLRKLHLRMDFFDDILADFDGYQRRFTKDVNDANTLVTSAGLPPILAIAVDQSPAYGGRGHRIAKIAERAMLDVKAQIIETEDFYRRYNGVPMYVSRWEGHPNEVANFIWASMIAKELQDRKELQTFKRQPAGGQ